MIIDAFMFFNELDLLEIRLNELWDVVDKFVIVESLQMHGSIATKRANLADNWERFRPYAGKMVYEIAESLQPPFRDHHDTWPRENFNRNLLRYPVLKTSQSPADIVIISDCDEIPRADIVRYLHAQPGQLKALTLDSFYYNVNNYCGPWNGPVVGRTELLTARTPQEFRGQRDSTTRIANAGWHFSYFGGAENIRYKVQNFAHAYDDTAQALISRPVEELEADIRVRRDLYRRVQGPLLDRWASNDPRLPKYFRENLERFKGMTDGN